MKKPVSHGVLVALLAPLIGLDDKDVARLESVEAADCEKLKEIATTLIVPNFKEHDGPSQSRFRDSLEYFLVHAPSDIGEVASAHQVPIASDEALIALLTMVWVELFGPLVPKQTIFDDFVVDDSVEFQNSLRVRRATTR